MKRFLKPLKYLALALVAMVAIALVVNGVLNAWASSRLERRVAALHKAGQPVSLVDLARPELRPKDNAATHLRQAQLDVNAIQKEVSAALDAAPKADQDRFDEGELSPALKSALQAAFAAHPQVVPQIEWAATCSAYAPPLDTSTDTATFQEAVMANSNDFRNVMRVLNYRALLQLSDGDSQAALRTCLVMFSLCRLYDSQPLLNSYLVSLACRGLTVGVANRALRTNPLTDDSRDELDAELARHETIEPFEHALATERSFGLQRYRELGHEIPLGSFIGLPWLKNDASGYCDLFAEAIGLVGLPSAKSQPALADSLVVENAGPLAGSVVPALQAVFEATCRVRARLRALRVLNALARHPEVADAATPEPRQSWTAGCGDRRSLRRPDAASEESPRGLADLRRRQQSQGRRRRHRRAGRRWAGAVIGNLTVHGEADPTRGLNSLRQPSSGSPARGGPAGQRPAAPCRQRSPRS